MSHNKVSRYGNSGTQGGLGQKAECTEEFKVLFFGKPLHLALAYVIQIGFLVARAYCYKS